jgi:hypothetical protein
MSFKTQKLEVLNTQNLKIPIFSLPDQLRLGEVLDDDAGTTEQVMLQFCVLG